MARAHAAFPGQKGFVGGSMGDNAVIVQGTVAGGEAVQDLQQRALFSTVHGAGRVMSRTAAAGKRNRRGRQLSRGAISPQMMHTWVREKDVVLRGGDWTRARTLPRLPDVPGPPAGTIENSCPTLPPTLL